MYDAQLRLEEAEDKLRMCKEEISVIMTDIANSQNELPLYAEGTMEYEAESAQLEQLEDELRLLQQRQNTLERAVENWERAVKREKKTRDDKIQRDITIAEAKEQLKSVNLSRY